MWTGRFSLLSPVEGHGLPDPDVAGVVRHERGAVAQVLPGAVRAGAVGDRLALGGHHRALSVRRARDDRRRGRRIDLRHALYGLHGSRPVAGGRRTPRRGCRVPGTRRGSACGRPGRSATTVHFGGPSLGRRRADRGRAVRWRRTPTPARLADPAARVTWVGNVEILRRPRQTPVRDHRGERVQPDRQKAVAPPGVPIAIRRLRGLGSSASWMTVAVSSSEQRLPCRPHRPALVVHRDGGRGDTKRSWMPSGRWRGTQR